MMAFPGSEIDGIAAHSFIKTMGELNLRPIRFNNVGATWLYPTFLKTALFGTHMLTDPDHASAIRHVFNAGAQLDLELVLFSYLKITWSAGYARMFEAGHGPRQQWMFSLKLLGNQDNSLNKNSVSMGPTTPFIRSGFRNRKGCINNSISTGCIVSDKSVYLSV